MTPLDWQPVSSASTAAPKRKEIHSPAHQSSSADGGTVWFAVSMGLIGIIFGFSAGKIQQGSLQGLAASPPSAIGGLADPSVAPEIPPQDEAAQLPGGPAFEDVPPVDLDRDHIRGDKNAEIAVIEYSDFQCPFCARVHPTFKELLSKFDGKVMWVYRHFPLAFHADAKRIAEASECAAELGGNESFWKFTDAIFEKSADGSALTEIAKGIGLEAEAFESCLESGKYAQRVEEDLQGGYGAGISGTPGNIVLNLRTKELKLIEGAYPLSSFEAAISELE